MPFAGYEDFDACVRANSDKDDPDAYCAAIKREVAGEGSLTDAEQDAYRRLGDAEPTPDADGDTVRILAEFKNPGSIQRVEESGNTVRYKRVMLLSPGIWADAGSEMHVDYNEEAIAESADNWVDMDTVLREVPDWGMLDNEARAQKLRELGDRVTTESGSLNFLHGPAMYGADSLDDIGEVPVDSVFTDEAGSLYGDLVLTGDTPQSQTAIDLMDEVLEAADEPGAEPPPVGPSVEIPADRVRDDGQTLALEEAYFSGVGIVFGPASKPVEIGEQARDRAIAMAAADAEDTDDAGVVFRAATDTEADAGAPGGTKTVPRHRRHMGDPTDFDPEELSDEELARTLETMREDMEAIERTLQDMAAATQLIEQAEGAGFDIEGSTVAELVSFVESELDADEEAMAELQSLAEAYLQSVDSESLEEAPAAEMRDWLAEQAEGEEGDGENPDGGEETEDEGDVTMGDLEEVKNVVGEVASHLGDVKDLLSAREEDREETIENLERRLSEIEDEPVNRSLTGETPDGDFAPDSGEPGGTEGEEHEEAWL